MDFANFGVVSFTKQAKVAPFVDYLDQGKVMATECKQCGKKYFPPRADCPYCLSSEMEWVEIKSKGKLLTFTTVNYGPSGFEDVAPYSLGIVEFPEGVRVLAKIRKKVDVGDIKIGMELRVVPVVLSEDRFAYGLEP
ncbi:MAG: Zn-ribbon domain-containing OB-fold protein [Dehalococcoidia bacterium]|nr:Zn-ribbon domain-containing OB-fold protein [Dehalococcoidia bacterium]